MNAASSLLDSKRGARGASSTQKESATHSAISSSCSAGGKDTRQSASGCPFIADDDLQSVLKDRLLASARDIEDAAVLGSAMGACAYYARGMQWRKPKCVALPYSMLLHRGTRESLGLQLDGSVVIFDEAHNVIDAINATYSATLTLPQAASAHAQLRAYLERYRSRLSRDNLLNCTQLADFLHAIVKLLQPQCHL